MQPLGSRRAIGGPPDPMVRRVWERVSVARGHLRRPAGGESAARLVPPRSARRDRDPDPATAQLVSHLARSEPRMLAPLAEDLPVTLLFDVGGGFGLSVCSLARRVSRLRHLLTVDCGRWRTYSYRPAYPPSWSIMKVDASKIAEIATAVGYESEAGSCRAFTRDCGETPAAWRKRHLVQ